MGLDQYALIRKDETICTWRKHNRLQGFMEELWREKTDSEEVFNCVDLELDLGDIEKLEKAIYDKTMPATEGFFFGNDSYTEGDYEEYHLKDDIKFIQQAKEALKAGKRVIYNSWW